VTNSSSAFFLIFKNLKTVELDEKKQEKDCCSFPKKSCVRALMGATSGDVMCSIPPSKRFAARGSLLLKLFATSLAIYYDE